LQSQQEYDEQGELISYNFYSDSGVLALSGSTKEKQSFETEFYDNGKLKTETVSETSKEADSEVEVSNIREYYQDGHLWRESRKEDGVLDGVMKVWDKKGNLVLRVQYSNGLIGN
jgi:antitoxin component YwqK of YwqJK toxin-antitoxin module